MGQHRSFHHLADNETINGDANDKKQQKANRDGEKRINAINSEKPEGGMRYCYPVFGEELPLEKALVDTPLALCIGYEQEEDEKEVDIRQIGEKMKSILKLDLDKAGFDMEYAAKEFVRLDRSQAGAIMVANAKFKQLFPR